MFTPEEIVAYTEKESWTFDGMLRTEFRVLIKQTDRVRADYHMPSYLNLAWGDLFVLEQRLAEAHNDGPTQHHPWRMLDVAATIDELAACVPNQATVTHAGLRALTEALAATRAAEVEAAKKAEAERRAAERAAQEAKELERASQACFERMLYGTERNRAAALSWQALVARVKAQPADVFERLRADTVVVEKQAAVVNETRIPQKRVAIRNAVTYLKKTYGI